MTERKNNAKPTHIAYQVISRGEESYWRQIGAASANSDGKGINMQLDAVPLDGRITLRIPSEKQPPERRD